MRVGPIKLGFAFFALILVSAKWTFAQVPFKIPASSVLETVSLSNLARHYPNRMSESGNVTEIIKYLSTNSPYSMRLSTMTETVRSREMVSQSIKQSGVANTNLHFHINFSSSQILVEELNCPPNSYLLNVWDSVIDKAKIRSDGFFDGKYFVMMPGRVLSQMEFGSMDAFKEACIAHMQNTMPPKTQNILLEQACVDFRQYARFQNLGHEGVVPSSFVFIGNDFVCSGIRGEHVSGRIETNAVGLVDKIFFQASEHYGPRVFLLFYETFFTNAAWYPSRILDAIKRGSDFFAVRQIHTVYNAHAGQGVALSIPKNTIELYGTNPSTQFEWTSNMAYEVAGTQVLARPSLLERDSGDGTTGKKYILGALLIAFSIISLAFVVYFFRSNKQQKTNNR